MHRFSDDVGSSAGCPAGAADLRDGSALSVTFAREGTRASGLAVATMAGILAATVLGCLHVEVETFGARHGPGGPPPVAGPRGGSPRAVSFGVSGGFFMPNDSIYANGLASGMMWDVNAAVWLSSMLALQVDYGRSVMLDRGDLGASTGLGGEMTASPLTVSGIVSLPMPAYYGYPVSGPGALGMDAYRWRFGLGGGTMGLSHTEYDVPSSMKVMFFTVGAEWLVLPGDRLFMASEIYFGRVIQGQSGLDEWSWDLTSIVTLRAGIEIGF